MAKCFADRWLFLLAAAATIPSFATANGRASAVEAQGSSASIAAAGGIEHLEPRASSEEHQGPTSSVDASARANREWRKNVLRRERGLRKIVSDTRNLTTSETEGGPSAGLAAASLIADAQEASARKPGGFWPKAILKQPPPTSYSYSPGATPEAPVKLTVPGSPAALAPPEEELEPRAAGAHAVGPTQPMQRSINSSVDSSITPPGQMPMMARQAAHEIAPETAAESVGPQALGAQVNRAKWSPIDVTQAAPPIAIARPVEVNDSAAGGGEMEPEPGKKSLSLVPKAMEDKPTIAETDDNLEEAEDDTQEAENGENHFFAKPNGAASNGSMFAGEVHDTKVVDGGTQSARPLQVSMPSVKRIQEAAPARPGAVFAGTNGTFEAISKAANGAHAKSRSPERSDDYAVEVKPTYASEHDVIASGAVDAMTDATQQVHAHPGVATDGVASRVADADGAVDAMPAAAQQMPANPVVATTGVASRVADTDGAIDAMTGTSQQISQRAPTLRVRLQDVAPTFSDSNGAVDAMPAATQQMQAHPDMATNRVASRVADANGAVDAMTAATQQMHHAPSGMVANGVASRFADTSGVKVPGSETVSRVAGSVGTLLKSFGDASKPMVRSERAGASSKAPEQHEPKPSHSSKTESNDWWNSINATLRHLG